MFCRIPGWDHVEWKVRSVEIDHFNSPWGYGVLTLRGLQGNGCSDLFVQAANLEGLYVCEDMALRRTSNGVSARQCVQWETSKGQVELHKKVGDYIL